MHSLEAFHVASDHVFQRIYCVYLHNNQKLETFAAVHFFSRICSLLFKKSNIAELAVWPMTLTKRKMSGDIILSYDC